MMTLCYTIYRGRAQATNRPTSEEGSKMTKEKFYTETQWAGHYPAVLTTDGKHYGVEFRGNHSGWYPNDSVIASIAYDGCFPSFTDCERRRRLVKAGKWVSESEYMK